MKSGLFILLCFVAGVLVGQQDLVSRELGENALALALYIMLLLAGMCMGFDTRNFLIVRALGLRVVLLPLGIMAGTALGALAAWALLGLLQHTLSLRDVMAVGAGFGYYSLSSVIIARLGDAALGSVALLANITRELVTLLLAPLLVRMAGGLAPVATGGAASMDTCMPVIARYAGERYAIMGVFSGMVLTMLVPLLVTGLFTWF